MADAAAAARSVEQVLEKTKADPRFTRGLALLKEKRFEEAVAAFEDILRTMIEVENESESLAVAPVYYEYGHALLSVAEATASVFGAGAAEDDGGDVEQEAKDTADDLQVAWEMLEIARVIYSRFPDELAIEKELARVYMRLGDLGMESEVFEQAKSDYEKSLMLRKKILTATNDQDTTLLADLYCCLAISCIYQDATAKGDDVTPTPGDKVQSSINREQEGLKYYVLAGRVMADNIYRVAKDCPAQLLDFVQQRLPQQAAEGASATEPASKGKGKQKATTATDTLDLEYKMDNITTLRDDFLTCVKVFKSLNGTASATEDVNEDNLNKDEAQLLEYFEIYVELKEKVDGIKESSSAELVGFGSQQPSATSVSDGPVTTIGFGTAPAAPVTTIGFGAAAPAVTTIATSTAAVNVIPVVKKRKIAPQAATPTAPSAETK